MILTYLATAWLSGARVDILTGVVVLFPSMYLLSALIMAGTVLLRNRFIGYLAAAVYWLGVLSLEERFPWIISPLYFLSEYTFKTGRDLLLLNKAALVVGATVLLVVAFRRGMRYA